MIYIGARIFGVAVKWAPIFARGPISLVIDFSELSRAHPPAIRMVFHDWRCADTPGCVASVTHTQLYYNL